MFANRPKMLVITGLSALFIFMACKKDNADTNDPAPVDPVAAALNLPATPFNYASIVQPAYLNGPNITGQINTPANQEVSVS